MTTTTNRHFPAEVLEQPAALRRTEDYLGTALTSDFFQSLHNVNRVIWTGSGDCYFIGMAIASLMERYAGIPASAVEAYDFVTATPGLDAKTLVVGFSSSGKSVYTVEALETARVHGARTLAVTNNPDNRLTQVAESALTTQAGRSFSFPSKTTTSALLTGLRLAEALGSKRTADHKAASIGDIVSSMTQVLEDAGPAAMAAAGRISAARRVVVVGSGLARSAALVGAAKLIETSEIAASANNSEEFLHLIGFGIQEVDAVIVLDDGNLRSRLAAQYATRQGAFTVVITSEEVPADLPAQAQLILSAGKDDVTRLFADLAVLHILAVAVSANRGTNPDIPSGVDLDYVIGLLYTDPVDGWNAEAAKGVTHAAG